MHRALDLMPSKKKAHICTELAAEGFYRDPLYLLVPMNS